MKQMMNPVNWFEIYVDDLERAKKFYEKVFDIKMSDLPVPEDQHIRMIAFPWDNNALGASGALVKMEQMKAGNNSTLVYFHSEDCKIEESRVEAAGGKVMKPKTSIGQYGFISICIDTEGNCFGLHSMK